jgi:hypothetical protein
LIYIAPAYSGRLQECACNSVLIPDTGYTLFQNPLFFPRDFSGGAKSEIDDSVCRIKKKGLFSVRSMGS